MAETTQLEQAIRIAMDPSVEAIVKQQAMGYISQIKADSDGWERCVHIADTSRYLPQVTKYP